MQTASGMLLLNCVTVNLSLRPLWQLRRGLRGSEWFGLLWHSVIKDRSGLQLWRSPSFPAVAEVQALVAASYVRFNPYGAECCCALCAPRGLSRGNSILIIMHQFGDQERYFGTVCACSYEAAHFVLGALLSKYTSVMSWAVMFLITLLSNCFALHPQKCIWNGRCLYPQVAGKQGM